GYALDEMELVTRTDDGRAVQGRAVLGRRGCKDLLTVRGWCDAGSSADGKLGVPEVRDDPHPQQVVAEVPERAVVGRAGDFPERIVVVAAVDRVAVARNPPVLSERGRGDAGHREAWRLSIAHGAARLRCEGSVHELRRADVGLEVADDV